MVVFALGLCLGLLIGPWLLLGLFVVEELYGDNGGVFVSMWLVVPVAILNGATLAFAGGVALVAILIRAIL